MNDGSIVFERRDIQNYFDFRGKYSIALKLDSELKFSGVFEAGFQENTKSKDTLFPDKSLDLKKQTDKEIDLVNPTANSKLWLEMQRIELLKGKEIQAHINMIHPELLFT